MRTFLLVHGAWHGGWCWHKVVAALEAEGHRVLAPDLPGHGIDRTPLDGTTLESLASHIRDLLEAAEERVILVGHSYGGTIITQAAEWCPDKVKRLVYLTAFAPLNGQSTRELGGGDADTRLNSEMDVHPESGTVTVRPSALRAVFYGHCDEADVTLARALLVPEALAGVGTPVATTGNWERLPRNYILCTDDQAIGLARQQSMAEAAGCRIVASLDTDHSPFFSAVPAMVAALTRD